MDAPPTTLSSLIVERRAASPRQLDEALSRQLLLGGDLETNLLELGVLSEPALLAMLSQLHRVDPMPPGELPRGDAEGLRAVPADAALRHLVHPLAMRSGALVVVVAQPLARPVAAELVKDLDVVLVQRLAASPRILQALARDRRLPLDERVARLLARMDGGAGGPVAAPERPAMGRLPRPASLPPVAYARAAPPDAAPKAAVGVSRTVHVGVAAMDALERALSSSPPPPEARPSNPPAARPPAAPTIAGGAPPPASGAPSASAAPPVAPTMRPAPPPGFLRHAAAATAAEVERKRRARASIPPGVGALAGWAARATREPPPPGPGVERARGPLTPAAAESALEQAASREAVLATFLRFARQYFEYAALFVVHGELAEGWDAAGPGAARPEVRAIGVPLDLPSAFAEARARGGVVTGAAARQGIDAIVAEDLGRAASAAALVLPVVVRGRTVALLWADDGAEPVDLRGAAEVVAAAPLAAAALERIIVQRKASRGGDGAAWSPRPPDATPIAHVPRVVASSRPSPSSARVPLPPPAAFADASALRALADALDAGEREPGAAPGELTPLVSVDANGEPDGAG